jgi:hypothetical protein
MANSRVNSWVLAAVSRHGTWSIAPALFIRLATGRSERLDPTTFLSMVRVLGIIGYNDLIADIEKDYLLP